MKLEKDSYALLHAYKKAALIKVTFNYYMLYQRKEEGKWIDTKLTAALTSQADDLIKALEKALAGEEDSNHAQEIETMRKQVIQNMEVLTAYADRMLVYEYIINRMEERFAPCELLDEEVFVEEIIHAITLANDNAMIQENIKECMAQLPVRMTKRHFFDWLRESILLYKGSDNEALQAYLYILRSATTLYHPKGMELYFKELKEELEVFLHADYKNMQEDAYLRMVKALTKMTEELTDKTDFYVELQEMLNGMEALWISLPLARGFEYDKLPICIRILKETNTLILHEKPEEEWMEEELSKLEGEQEQAFEQIMRYESKVLQKRMSDYPFEVKDCFDKMEKLISSSMFVDFDKEVDHSVVSEAYLNQVADELERELTALFQTQPKEGVRAIMAAALGRMPAMFETMDDVKEYIENSLKQCSDPSEKNVSMKLLKDYIGK